MRHLVKRDFIAIAAIVALFGSLMLSAGLADSAIADPGHFTGQKATNDGGMLYSESSVVKGTGDVSIRGSFSDKAMGSSGWLKGNGSINLETVRSVSKKHAAVNFDQKSDLVFAGGQLISIKNLRSPFFLKGSGASISEWSTLSHVDKSETDIIRSINRLNNTLVFKTELAFDGKWNIENQIGSGFGMKKGAERYSGSFETQKDIEFVE